MATAKIDIKVGSLHFLGEGEQEWVSTQLDKLLAQAHTLGKLGDQVDSGEKAKKLPEQREGGTLSSFLNSKNARGNQVSKFLATAAWLYLKGKQRMPTSDIAKTLKDNNQGRLGNPADCLNQNVRKGFCEKEGREFFITRRDLQSWACQVDAPFKRPFSHPAEPTRPSTS